jgi:hypothetical protein
VWETSTEVLPSQLIVTKGRVGIPIAIAIGAGVPATERDERGNGIEWTLEVELVPDDAPMYSSSFEVPIYERR